jgi:hypothetical protein
MNTPSRPVQILSSSIVATIGALTLSAAAIGASPSPDASGPTASSCWTDQPGVVGTVDHPTDAEAVVLRMAVGGGFVPVEFAFMENPTFTLYGNDVAIFRTGTGSSESIFDALPAFACARLTPDQVDELLTLALDDGGLRDARSEYPNPFIADVPSTTFTIDADGVSKTVLVEALGFEDGAPDPDARAQLMALAGILGSFDTEVDDAVPYEVPGYEGMLTEAWPELEGTPLAWPWEDIAPADFGADFESTVELTPSQVGMVTSIPSGGQAYILLETPDGSPVALTVTPVLPAR